MSVVSHIEHLQNKHAEYETVLANEMARPLPDFYAIKAAKKQKLLIKEEIARLQHEVAQQRKHAS